MVLSSPPVDHDALIDMLSRLKLTAALRVEAPLPPAPPLDADIMGAAAASTSLAWYDIL